jgi:hypothetical protein
MRNEWHSNNMGVDDTENKIADRVTNVVTEK